MSHWEAIRQLARRRQAEARAIAEADSAGALLAAAERMTGVKRRPLRAGDPLLDGGEAMLDPEAATVWFNAEVEPGLAAFYQAHEFAHLWLDGERAACDASDLDGEASEERVAVGVQRVEGYGPQERREIQANIFAREFLLPAESLRRWFLEDGLDGSAIARRVGLVEGIVFHQLAYALLTPRLAAEAGAQAAPGAVPRSPELDPSQKRAAHATRGPLLLEAGPGTGKTKTLVGRIVFLLREQGVGPSSILALTFSNKAAEEMRERVAAVAPAAAPYIWMGTFHAFGLELLRKYGTRLGLPPSPNVLDPAAALFLLERLLPSLRLYHYQNLYEPTLPLRDMLQAISRAKDELVGPERYAELARAMRERAVTQDEVEAAEKALEVAGVYAFYQETFEREGRLDFGDLIFKSVMLLQSDADLRAELRENYRHILVDEYQDMNRASGILLRELAGRAANADDPDGSAGLWVVGDVRQSIYRFRGAAPINMRVFPQDFPGAQVLSLRRNYRSQPRIVEAFSEFAPQMQAARGAPFTPWEAHRPDEGGRVRVEIADDGVAEGEGLAREIERQRANGIPYRDQAVLCRSHTSLARIAEILEREGVPVLYLGDFFEREEVRDLLALVSLTAEGDGRGLLRVGRFLEYNVPLADVRALLALAREQDVPFPRALSLAPSADGISTQGKAAFALLQGHLDGLSYGSNAWGLLARYLFARSNYLRPLLEDATVGGQQRRLALFQLLQFAHEGRDVPVENGEDPKRRFLESIRRLETFGESRQLRQLPEWASGLDAVRLLTVHASKGLEFRAVYLPVLGQGYFPARRQPQPCPAPAGMLPEGETDGHDEEEECLFFVALSRARDLLCLSRARHYGNRTSNASKLLAVIADVLPQPPDGEATWRAKGADMNEAEALPASRLESPTFDVEALERYLICPRRYYYEYVVGLSGNHDDSAYVQFHRCVYAVLRWVEDEQANGRPADEAAAQARLAEAWAVQGPAGHPYELIYRQIAEGFVARAVRRPASRRPAPRPDWVVPLRRGRVRFRPDHVEIREDGTELVQRLRTGRIGKGEKDKNIYALYQAAAAAEPGKPREIQIVSLSEDEIEPVSLAEKTLASRLDKYDEAIVGILEARFPPQPSERECPRCPHYFICPMAEDN